MQTYFSEQLSHIDVLLPVKTCSDPFSVGRIWSNCRNVGWLNKIKSTDNSSSSVFKWCNVVVMNNDPFTITG